MQGNTPAVIPGAEAIKKTASDYEYKIRNANEEISRLTIKRDELVAGRALLDAPLAQIAAAEEAATAAQQ